MKLFLFRKNINNNNSDKLFYFKFLDNIFLKVSVFKGFIM